MTIERFVISAGITVASLTASAVINGIAGKKEKAKYGIPTKKEQRKAAKEAAKQKAPEVVAAPAATVVEQPAPTVAPQQPPVQPVQFQQPQPALLGYDAAGQPVYGYPQAQPQA